MSWAARPWPCCCAPAPPPRAAATSAPCAALRRAGDGFDAAGMGLYAAAARRRLGELLGGDEGQTLVARADAWMRLQRIENPPRMTEMLAPGFRG